jgi:hypothetical protein
MPCEELKGELETEKKDFEDATDTYREQCAFHAIIRS